MTKRYYYRVDDAFPATTADNRTSSRREDVLRTRREATARLPLRRADYAGVTQDARNAALRARASDSRASRGHAVHARTEMVLRRQRATLATRRGRTQPRRVHSWSHRGQHGHSRGAAHRAGAQGSALAALGRGHLGGAVEGAGRRGVGHWARSASGARCRTWHGVVVGTRRVGLGRCRGAGGRLVVTWAGRPAGQGPRVVLLAGESRGRRGRDGEREEGGREIAAAAVAVARERSRGWGGLGRALGLGGGGRLHGPWAASERGAGWATAGEGALGRGAGPQGEAGWAARGKGGGWASLLPFYLFILCSLSLFCFYSL
jgi:hypothetical protein